MSQRVQGHFKANSENMEKLINKHATIDWSEIERKRVERLRDQAARGVRDAETLRYLGESEEAIASVTPKKSSRPARRSPGPSRRGQRPALQLDVDRVVELYKEGYTVKQLAEDFKVSKDTIKNRLKDREVYEPNRDKTGGRPVSDTCSRGHSMEDAFISKDPQGNTKRECRKCKAIRDQRWNKKHKPWRKPENSYQSRVEKGHQRRTG